MTPRVALLFPPATDPRAPRLPLPWLAATLRRAGIETSLHDLDVLGLRAVLDPEMLRRAGEAVRARGDASLGRLARLSESLPERIGHALGAFRDLERFLDPNDRNASRDVMLDALDLVSAASPRAVRYSVEVMKYEVEGVDATRFADLVEVTADPRANLFLEIWERDVFPALDRERPAIAGVSISVRQQILPGLMLARALKERGHFVVLGGNLFTRFAARLETLPEFFDVFADGVVVYEGETAMLELVEQLGGRRDFSKIPNFLHAEGGKVRAGPRHVEDVAALPTPDFTGMPLDLYLSPVRVLPLLAGKGCYWDACKFCEIPYINRVSRVRYRLRPSETVARDVLELARRFDCRHFFFGDEAILPRTLVEVARALEPESGLGLSFGAYARFEPSFTREVCRTIADLGVRKLFFGLESASPDTLAHMDKGLDLPVVRKVLEHCDEAGIHVIVFSMIGFPEEDEESAERTIRFYEENADLLDRPWNTVDIHPLEIQMRTPYAEEAGRFGILLPPEATASDFVVGVGTLWQNTRGIPRSRMDELLAEAGRRLARVYRRYHAWPPLLWPQFEEWNVIYGGAYRGRTFRYRVGLPEDGEPERYRLRWNPAALVERVDGQVRIEGRSAGIRIPGPLDEALTGAGFRTGRQILASLVELSAAAGEVADPGALREALTELARSNLLHLEPSSEEQDDPPRLTGTRA